MKFKFRDLVKVIDTESFYYGAEGCIIKGAEYGKEIDQSIYTVKLFTKPGYDNYENQFYAASLELLGD